MPVKLSEDELCQLLGRFDRNVPPEQLSQARLLLIACCVPYDDEVHNVKCVSDLYTAIVTNISAFPGYDALTVLQYVLREVRVPVDDVKKLGCDESSLDACRNERILATLILGLSEGLTDPQFAELKLLARKRIDTHPEIVPTREDFFCTCVYLGIFEEEESLAEFKEWLEIIDTDDLVKKLEKYIEDRKELAKFPKSERESQSIPHSDPRLKGLVSGMSTGASKRNPSGGPSLAPNRGDGSVLYYQGPAGDINRPVNSAFLDQYQSIQFPSQTRSVFKGDPERVSYWIRHFCKFLALCVVGYIFCALLLLLAGFTSAVGYSGNDNETWQTFLIKPGDVRQFGQTKFLTSGQTIKLDPSWNLDSTTYNFELLHVSSQELNSLKKKRVVPFQEKGFNVSKLEQTRFTVPIDRDEHIPLARAGSTLDISISFQSNSITSIGARLCIFDQQYKVDDFLNGNSTHDDACDTFKVGTKGNVLPPYRKHNIPLTKEAYYQIGLDVPLDVVFAYNFSFNVMYVDGSKLTHLTTCLLSKDKTCTVGVGQDLDTRVLLVYYPESEPSKGIVHLLVEDTARFDFHSMQIVGIVLFVLLLIVVSFVTGFCCYVLRYKLSQSKETTV